MTRNNFMHEAEFSQLLDNLSSSGLTVFIVIIARELDRTGRLTDVDRKTVLQLLDDEHVLTKRAA